MGCERLAGGIHRRAHRAGDNDPSATTGDSVALSGGGHRHVRRVCAMVAGRAATVVTRNATAADRHVITAMARAEVAVAIEATHNGPANTEIINVQAIDAGGGVQPAATLLERIGQIGRAGHAIAAFPVLEVLSHVLLTVLGVLLGLGAKWNASQTCTLGVVRLRADAAGDDLIHQCRIVDIAHGALHVDHLPVGVFRVAPFGQFVGRGNPRRIA
mmetsp:Transcript_8688/g.14743  ORF Transcript_8688/g.14743 Transcript_8688/m.14743 type:complete len:215 (+) Transcript_8688:975-1619(+)